MSTMQIAASGPWAGASMTMSQMRFPRHSGEVANRSIPLWSHVAAFASLSLGSLATNPALTYTCHFDTVHTNPVISLPSEEIVDWMNEDDGDLSHFLSFLDAHVGAHPEWVEPADEEQLDRLAKLLANVKV